MICPRPSAMAASPTRVTTKAFLAADDGCHRVDQRDLRAHREVDPRGDDDEGHGHRHDEDRRRLPQDVEQVVGIQKPGSDNAAQPNSLDSTLTIFYSRDIVIIDREKTQEILREQALSLSGLMDKEQYQEIGRILNAQFILTGKITRSSKQINISADLIRIKTAETITEVVRSGDADYFDDMVEILANNLNNRLTGKKEYIKIQEYKSPAVWYWFGTFAVTATSGIVFQSIYKDNQKNYENASQLKQFDNYYDKANTALNVRNVFLGMGVVALSGTIYHLLAGSNKNTIIAGSQNLSIIPNINFYENKTCFSLTFNF